MIKKTIAITCTIAVIAIIFILPNGSATNELEINNSGTTPSQTSPLNNVSATSKRANVKPSKYESVKVMIDGEEQDLFILSE